MKAKILVFSLMATFFFISCNKEETTLATPINAADVSENAKIDLISDDVLQIVESQSNETEFAGRGAENFLSDCARIITLEQVGNTWTRTVDFGDVNCSLLNGNMVRGKIIISFTNDFNASTRTISYTFDNFYHNDRHIEGNRTVVKTILANGHPQATINLNLTVTNLNGGVYTRVGNRVREFTEGYNTPFNVSDNVFSITGSWTTTLPSGIVHTATITTPIIKKMNCQYIVSGTVSIVRNTNTAVLDYGNGDCDANATVTINGVVHNITLGN
jgi:hypothetical protein